MPEPTCGAAHAAILAASPCAAAVLVTRIVIVSRKAGSWIADTHSSAASMP
jgi:hypothetical protein